MSREFFDSYSEAFDRLYGDDKSAVRSWVDRRFRRSMSERFDRTLGTLRERVKGKRVLDIGCGPGRYTVALAHLGAAEVIGLDHAENMLVLARRWAVAAKVDRQCRFVHSDFMDYRATAPFDFALAIGVFDYVMEPTAFLRKVRETVREAFIASFPVRWHWLTPQRKVRYALRRCPIRFYSERQVRGLLGESGLVPIEFSRMDRDYFVVASPVVK